MSDKIIVKRVEHKFGAFPADDLVSESNGDPKYQVIIFEDGEVAFQFIETGEIEYQVARDNPSLTAEDVQLQITGGNWREV